MIHELLSNSAWINPQIDYLLWLQNLREMSGGAFDQFFLKTTILGELTVPTLIMAIIYWCIDSMAGLYLFSLNAIGLMLVQYFKMIANIYRPWILSDKVHPAPAAFRTAGGYSFPSGHSAMASTSIGGIAYWYRSHKWLCVLLIFVVLLVGFSRNYLGVHTPQDVVVGLGTGFILIFVMPKVLQWCEKDKNRYLYILAVVDVLIMALVIYLCMFKTYPMDYVDGKLLVNPNKAIYNSFIYYGWTLGLLNGVFLCRRFWPFDAKEGDLKSKTFRGIIGLIIALSLLKVIDIKFWGAIHDYKITLLFTFVTGFFITGLYPLIFGKLLKRKG